MADTTPNPARVASSPSPTAPLLYTPVPATVVMMPVAASIFRTR